MFLLSFSHLLYTISRPNDTGIPSVDLTCDEEASPSYTSELTYKSKSQVLIDRVLTKAVVLSSHFKPIITKRHRSLTTVKLWRMGKTLAKLNTQQRKKQLEKWKKMTWKLLLKPTEVMSILAQEKENIREFEQKASLKHAWLTQEVEIANRTIQALQVKNTQLQQAYNELKGKEEVSSRKRKARKCWSDYSHHYKRQKFRELQKAVNSVLGDSSLDVVEVKVTDKETSNEVYLGCGSTSQGHPNPDEQVNMLLYAKEKFGISDAAYHELSMIFRDLPRSSQIKGKVKDLNERWQIKPTPNGTIGVQQPLKPLLSQKIEHCISSSPEEAPFHVSKTIRVKLTGDGTNIGSKLHVVNFCFSILDESNAAMSAYGNYPLCILKEPESYEQLKLRLHDICVDVQDIAKNGLSVGGELYHIRFCLGGDWKFLACICGLDAANSNCSCIWCICPKDERHLEKNWSIIDEEQGARTISGICRASKLPKRSPMRYNCSHEPLFPTIPIHNVIIDVLHLRLQICDTLINLLIRTLRLQDGLDKPTIRVIFITVIERAWLSELPTFSGHSSSLQWFPIPRGQGPQILS